MRSGRLTLLLVLAVVVGALAAPASASPPVKIVKLAGFAFHPRKLTIRKGTKVTWKWLQAPVPHNVTVKTGPVKFHSRTQTTGTYSHIFNRPGTYVLHCTIHPWMVETIVVK